MARRASGAGMYAGLVFLGIGFVVCMILAIVFYTRINAAEHAAQQAATTLRQYVSAEEQRSTEVTEMLGNTREQGTVVAQFRHENRRLKSRIVGDPDASLMRIEADIRSAEVEGDRPLLGELSRLRSEHRINQETITNLQNARTQAENRLEQAERQQRQLASEYEQARQQLQQQIDQLQQAQQRYQAQVDQARDTLQQQFATTRTDLQQELRNAQSRVTQLEEEKRQLETRLRIVNDQLRQRGAIGRVDSSISPDGQVVSIMPEERLVYIDLGSNQRVLLGLTFQVFDRMPGIVTNERGEYEGKATIEVVQVGENSSVARVVERKRGSTLNAGDVIANAVFDANMSFKFYVYGEFDIDGIGQTTDVDRRRIETMIQQWGGRVVPRREQGSEGGMLSYDVDFLVLGREPDLPAEPDPGETDPVVLNAYRQARQQYITYQELVAEAQALSVTILNQNRFLTMVGYYQR